MAIVPHAALPMVRASPLCTTATLRSDGGGDMVAIVGYSPPDLSGGGVRLSGSLVVGAWLDALEHDAIETGDVLEVAVEGRVDVEVEEPQGL